MVLATIVGMVLSLFFHMLDQMGVTNEAPDQLHAAEAPADAEPVA
jgi:hypothetical protein